MYVPIFFRSLRSETGLGLEHATIRDNIIYSSVEGYNEQRYQAVLEACALRPDIKILQDGDMTEIGEKGMGTVLLSRHVLSS